MVNGCTYCIHMHTNDALKAGESIDRLFGLASWYEAPFYDDAERAALALTDAVTQLGSHGVPDDVWDLAVKHWGDEGAGNLLLAIGTINLWNRIAITCRTPPRA
jgi:alkylhydroperoxidase family enzyme